MRKIQIGMLLLIGLFGYALGTEFYVAPDGKDAGPGTKDQPFATLGRAKEAVRQINRQAAEPITVWIRAGHYFLNEPLVFTPEDSGTEKSPITYSACPGEKAVISGGKILKAQWKPSGEGMYQCTPPDEIIHDGRITQLFIGETRLPRPRLPKEGAYKMPGEEREERDWFYFKPGDVRDDWHNLTDVEVVDKQHWSDTRIPIASVDTKQNIVKLAGGGWRPLTWSEGYFLENVFEAMTEPGQWYYDRPAKVLYYRPRAGEKINEVEFVVPVHPELVRFDGDPAAGKLVCYITLRGLTLAYSAWRQPATGYSYPQAAVPWVEPDLDDTSLTKEMVTPITAAIIAAGAKNIVLDHNTIAHTGAWAIHFSLGCQENSITGNDIYDIGAGAIRLGVGAHTGKDYDLTGHTTVSDNRVRDGSHIYMGATGVWVGHSGNNLISHNEVTGNFQMAISVGWNWDLRITPCRENIIEYNHCYHLGYGPLDSHSIIYALGFSPGTVIRYNLVNDAAGDAFGIALDEGSSGIRVENNIVHHTSRGFHFNRNCICNIVQNNIFALTTQAAQIRLGDFPPPGTLNFNITYRNIYYWKEGKLFLDKFKWPDFVTVHDYNLYFDTRSRDIKFLAMTFDEWKEKGFDKHSIIADPKFVDPDKGDFRLQPDSPAIGLGFVPIDLSGVGPRTPPGPPTASCEKKH